VHGDVLPVAGTGFPADAHFLFGKGGRIVGVQPTIAQAHLLVIDALPAELPLGSNILRVVGRGFSSDRVPVAVIEGPAPRVRGVHAGPPTARPYTVAIVASPAVLQFDGTLRADTIATDPVLFNDMAAMSLRQLSTLPEDLLRADDLDRRMRIVTARNPGSPADRIALVEETPLAVLAPRLRQISDHLGGFGVHADVAIALSGSLYPTASAIPTLDDSESPDQAYALDELELVRRESAAALGCMVMPRSKVLEDDAPMLHEFGHAASPQGFAMCTDLHVETLRLSEIYAINRKFRAQAGDPIPRDFGTLDGIGYASDLNRPGSYPAGWASYHPGAGRPCRTSWTATPRSTCSTASPERGSRTACAPRSTVRSFRCSRCPPRLRSALKRAHPGLTDANLDRFEVLRALPSTFHPFRDAQRLEQLPEKSLAFLRERMPRFADVIAQEQQRPLRDTPRPSRPAPTVRER
jgi:hypothetical protein